MDEIYKSIGGRIRQLRKCQHMSIAQLAVAVHKSTSSMSKYERGELVMDVATLVEIANVLRFPVAQLMYGFGCESCPDSEEVSVPPLFRHNSLYLYYYNGRQKGLRRVVLIREPGKMDILAYFRMQDMTDFDSAQFICIGEMQVSEIGVCFIIKNPHMKFDLFITNFLSYMITEKEATGALFGLTTPFQSIATKCLLSCDILPEDQHLISRLLFSKDEIANIKKCNTLIIG